MQARSLPGPINVLIIAGDSSRGCWHRLWVLEINTQEGVFLSVLSVLEFQHLAQSLGHLPPSTTERSMGLSDSTLEPREHEGKH